MHFPSSSNWDPQKQLSESEFNALPEECYMGESPERPQSSDAIPVKTDESARDALNCLGASFKASTPDLSEKNVSQNKPEEGMFSSAVNYLSSFFTKQPAVIERKYDVIIMGPESYPSQDLIIDENLPTAKESTKVVYTRNKAELIDDSNDDSTIDLFVLRHFEIGDNPIKLKTYLDGLDRNQKTIVLDLFRYCHPSYITQKSSKSPDMALINRLPKIGDQEFLDAFRKLSKITMNGKEKDVSLEHITEILEVYLKN